MALTSVTRAFVARATLDPGTTLGVTETRPSSATCSPHAGQAPSVLWAAAVQADPNQPFYHVLPDEGEPDLYYQQTTSWALQPL